MMTGVGYYFNILLRTQLNAKTIDEMKTIISPIKALLIPLSCSSPIPYSAISVSSVAPFFVLIAISTTAPKQKIIPTSSIIIIGSANRKNAIIDIQKGFIYHITITRESGAIETARLRRKKLT